MENLSFAALVFLNLQSQNALSAKQQSRSSSTFAPEYLSSSFKILIFNGKATAEITILNTTTIASTAKKVYVLFAMLNIIIITKRSYLIRFTHNQWSILIRISMFLKEKMNDKSEI